MHVPNLAHADTRGGFYDVTPRPLTPDQVTTTRPNGKAPLPRWRPKRGAYWETNQNDVFSGDGPSHLETWAGSLPPKSGWAGNLGHPLGNWCFSTVPSRCDRRCTAISAKHAKYLASEVR